LRAIDGALAVDIAKEEGGGEFRADVKVHGMH